MRERFFTPRLRVKSYDELNAWLLDQCVAYAKAHRHPGTTRRRRSGRCSRRSVPAWCRMPGASTGSTPCPHRSPRPASCGSTRTNTRLRRSAVGRPVEIRAYADRIELRQDGRIVGEHRALLRARPDGVRSLALRAGSGPQARCAEERCAVQGLGAAGRAGAGPPQARRRCRWRPPDGRHPHRGAERRSAGGRSGLPGSAARGRPFRGCRHQHPGPAPRTRAAGHDHDAGCAAAAAMRLPPIARDTTASGGSTDGAFRDPRHHGAN